LTDGKIPEQLKYFASRGFRWA